jgi:hypothetical protein
VTKARFICALVLAAAASANAQDAPDEHLAVMAEWNDAISWTSALREPMRRMVNHVVTTYGIASLAAVVCPVDQPRAADMFREAVAGLNSLPGDPFHESRKTLPVATFSGLWKVVMGPGLKCDPNLPQPSDAARAKRDSERREASTYLAQAKVMDDPDRAAQLAQAALEAGDPYELDITSITAFLIDFRVKAPDLADDLFQRAIAFTLEAQVPNVDALADLGNYLFLAPQFVGKSEPIQNRTTYTVNGSTFSNWQCERDDAYPDLESAYIGAVAGLFANNGTAASTDPVAAYALAYQLLPKARDQQLADTDPLDKFIAQMQTQYSAVAEGVEAKLGAEPAATSTQSKFARLMTQIRTALAAGRFAEAREILTLVDGVTVRSLVGSIIDFSEAAYAIREKDSDRALALAGKLPGGVKRALLYAGVVATSTNHLTSILALHLGLKDADLLSYEQRMAMLPALGTASSAVDRDETQAVLSLLIASLNDANNNPRKIRFDPRDSFGFDGPRALSGPGGFQEVIQGLQGRQSFPLKVTGLNAFSLEGFIAQAKDVDFMRLEASVETLRSELQLTKGYLALARLRLKIAKALVAKVTPQ